MPVCAPAQAGIDLARATLLHVASATEDWEAWAAACGIDLPPGPGITFDTVHMAVDAAAAGLGVAVGRRPVIDADIAAGRLVPAGPAVAATTGYWLVTGPAAASRPEVAAFADWLTALGESVSTSAQP